MFLKRFWAIFLIINLLGRMGIADGGGPSVSAEDETELSEYDSAYDAERAVGPASVEKNKSKLRKCFCSHATQRFILFLAIFATLAGFSYASQDYVGGILDEVLPKVDKIIAECGEAVDIVGNLTGAVYKMADVCAAAVTEISELEVGVQGLTDVANQTLVKLGEVEVKLDSVQATCQQMLNTCQQGPGR